MHRVKTDARATVARIARVGKHVVLMASLANDEAVRGRVEFGDLQRGAREAYTLA